MEPSENRNAESEGKPPEKKLKFQRQRADSPEPSLVSMKSDRSMGYPPNFSGGPGPSDLQFQRQRADSPEPSLVSMKSDRSMGYPPNFSSGPGPSDLQFQRQRADSPEPSLVSMKSDRSMGYPSNFSGGPGPSDPQQHPTEAVSETLTLMETNEDLQQDSNELPEDVLHRVIKKHKACMKLKYESLFEGITTEENRILLNSIYTKLYIIEGESEGVKEEHEVLQMEKTLRRPMQDMPVNLTDIFKPLQSLKRGVQEQDIVTMMAKCLRDKEKKSYGLKEQEIRTVLTKGIAGIGKTVSVQKFVVDWAEGKAYQDVDFMFVLPFRELNLIKDCRYSLHGLLCDLHFELKDLNPKVFDQHKSMFIIDGLDESRIPIEFGECEEVSDITTISSLSVLLTSLIKGDLHPSSAVWITSRPAAANQIPPQFISRVTEIQGFDDIQKEEYFRNRMRDQEQAQKIISHIKKVRSLHIMCHIPVFCWISATVLQKIINQHHTEIPKTLTEMYSHFLFTQTSMKNEKYDEIYERDPQKLLESNRTELLKLAELAFKQLMKGNVMFYEEDLRESSIDVTEASVYSGIFTEIFREECVLYQRKVYCFVHLSFQEFLAAVYVVHCYESKNIKELQCFEPRPGAWSQSFQLDELLIGAVDKAVGRNDGHLDLFVRFLLGVTLESNQMLLQGLLTHIQTSSEKPKEYIKKMIRTKTSKKYHISTDRCISLFLCLAEMKDQSVSRELEKLSNQKLTPEQCSELACVLLTSDEVLEELDLIKYNTSKEGYSRLVPVVSTCRKAMLVGCSLTSESCKTICSALQSVNSPLKHLDLSKNDLQDSGVALISAGLKSSHCKLETLRLAFCNLRTKACEYLSSALQSENTSLKSLDLSYNDLQDSGVQQLSAGLKSSHCKLEKLRLAGCTISMNSCKTVCTSPPSTRSTLKELDLSNNDLQDSGVELLFAGLKSSNCNLETLTLAHCHLEAEACKTLASVLQSEKTSLVELDLSNNDLQDSGVELLSVGLKSSRCKLQKLRLSGCMVTEEGCLSLVSALKSDLSPLRDLDLTYNNPRSGKVLLEDPQCKLEKLQTQHDGSVRISPGLKKYACYLTLDPNTAHTLLSLSEENRKVKRLRNPKEKPKDPDHPERFEYCRQVLSAEGLKGRFYWEAEWKGKEAVIAMSYRSIGRKRPSDDCLFGHNNQSWSLFCSTGRFYIKHNNVRTIIPALRLPSNRVGVYLDYEAGTLSFYSVSSETQIQTNLRTMGSIESIPHTLTHLYTIHSTFTEPLYAGIRVYFGSVRLVK